MWIEIEIGLKNFKLTTKMMLLAVWAFAEISVLYIHSKAFCEICDLN